MYSHLTGTIMRVSVNFILKIGLWYGTILSTCFLFSRRAKEWNWYHNATCHIDTVAQKISITCMSKIGMVLGERFAAQRSTNSAWIDLVSQYVLVEILDLVMMHLFKNQVKLCFKVVVDVDSDSYGQMPGPATSVFCMALASGVEGYIFLKLDEIGTETWYNKPAENWWLCIVNFMMSILWFIWNSLKFIVCKFENL